MPSEQRSSPHQPPARVAISYARADRRYLEKLLPFLAVMEQRGILSVWHDSLILAGTRFAEEIDAQIERADIFVAMVSVNYLDSPFCFEHEFARARALSAQRDMAIVPVLVSPCDWASTALGEYNALPFGSMYLAESRRLDRPLHEIAQEIKRLATARSGTRIANEMDVAPGGRQRVPQLPNQYVRPVRALDALGSAVTSQYHQNVLELDRRAAGIALCGFAGSGKTCLAIDLARSDAVQATFPDGVVWLHCGRDAEPVTLQRQLLRSVGLRRTLSDRWQENVDAMGAAVEGKSLLLILDDVWDSAQASAFTAGATNQTMLFLTTRFEDIARHVNARTVSIEKPTVDEALLMLANYARVQPEDLPRLSTEIVALSGRLPLALAVIGSLIENRVFGWNALLRVLQSSRDRAVIMRFETHLSNYEWRSITAAFDASIDALSQPGSDAILMCRALGRGMTVPRSTFMTMTAHVHGHNFGSYLEIEEELASRSLLFREIHANATFLSFHDLIVDYCYERCRDRENPHDVVLENLLRPRDTARADLVVRIQELSAQPYWRDEIFRHTAASTTYRDLGTDALFDLEWIRSRIENFGVDRVVLDCSELNDVPDVCKLHEGLRSCSHALSQRSAELLIQLDGRLPRRLMDTLLRKTPTPPAGTFWPRALRKNFSSSDGPTTRTLVVDGSAVRDIIVLGDDTRLVARCASGQIAVFELPSSQIAYAVKPSVPVTRHAAVHSGSGKTTIYLGASDSVIELDVLDYRMTELRPTTPGVGTLVDVTPTSTARTTFLGWTADSVYRADVELTDHAIVWDAVATGRQVSLCDVHEESGLFLIVETGGRITWGQIDAPVVMVDRLDAGGEVRSARLFDRGRRAVVAFFSGEIGTLDLTRREFSWRRPVHSDWVQVLTLDEDAGLLASGGHDQEAVVTDLADGAERLRVPARSGYVNDLVLASSDEGEGLSTYLVWSTLDGAIRLSQVGGDRRAIALGHAGRVNRILSPRSGELISCADDGTIRFWSIPAIFRSYGETSDHVEKVSCIAATDELVWSAGYDGSLKTWHAGLGDLVASGNVVEEPLHTLVPVGASECLVGTESGLVLLAETDRPQRNVRAVQVTQLGGWISAMRPVPACDFVAIGTGAGELALYDTRHRTIAIVSRLHTGAVRSLEADQGGRVLYSGGEDGRIVRFDLDAMTPVAATLAHDDWVHQMLMHEQTDLLFSISDDATLRAFDPSTLEPRSPVLRHDGWLAEIVPRPDGRAVFTMGQDGDLYTWDCTAFELMSRRAAHAGWISCAGLASRGTELVTVAHDQMIKLWSSSDGKPVGTVTIDTGANVNCLEVVNESTIVVGGENGKVFFVRIDAGV